MPGSWNSKSQLNNRLQRWERKGRSHAFPLDKLTDHTFEGEDFTGTSFGYTKLDKVIFSNCTLDRASFTGAILTECTFYGGSLRRTSFENVSLKTCFFADVNFYECRISKGTTLPAEFTWMKTLYFKGIPHEEQMYLWKNYPKNETIEDRKAFVAMAELEHGISL